MTTETANKEICEVLLKGLKIQRHDFINHIQVIHALLQLGRVEKALKYIEDLAKDPELMSTPLKMHHCPDECRRKAAISD